ncbi:hypothetical protein MTO96_022562 [Rhipicephalus appendiculatus]
MQKTLGERINWIRDENPTTTRVLEQYPALAVDSILHLEFEAYNWRQPGEGAVELCKQPWPTVHSFGQIVQESSGCPQ